MTLWVSNRESIRDAWSVLVVLPGRCGLNGHATAPSAETAEWIRLGPPLTLQLPVYDHDHHVRGCVTNCVTITTYHGGLPWNLWDA
jgi:hypothetical protein